MSNKSRLQTNNTNLQALIDKANALPDAGGGSSNAGEWICAASLPTTYVAEPGAKLYYYEVPENCFAVVISNRSVGIYDVTYKSIINNAFSPANVGTAATIKDADGSGTILQIETNYAEYIYLLPIYGTVDA